MADNITITASLGAAASVASDDVGGEQYQRVKIALGAANAYDMDLDSGQQTKANSLPVVLPFDQEVAISGSIGFSASFLGASATTACSLAVVYRRAPTYSSVSLQTLSACTTTASIPISGSVLEATTLVVSNATGTTMNLSASLYYASSALGAVWAGSIAKGIIVAFVSSTTNASELISSGVSGSTVGVPGLRSPWSNYILRYAASAAVPAGNTFELYG